MEIIIQLLLLAFGFLLLTKGADWFVDGAASIAQRLHIPQLIIGLTIVAMGTSAPEAAVSISAALKGNADITVGNIIGSNLMNILVILGLTAAITSLKVARSATRVEIPFMLGIFVLFMFLGLDGEVVLWEGILLWVLFIAYLVYLYMAARKEQMQPDDGSSAASGSDNEAVSRSLVISIIATIGGMAIIMWGSDIAVEAATVLATLLGFSQRFIGLTIVALGTSLPELVTSVTAAIKGNADIAIGNIIGSCIFNILFVLSTSALIVPIPFSSALIPDAIAAANAALLLFFLTFRTKKLNRPSGLILLAGYAIYFMFVLL